MTKIPSKAARLVHFLMMMVWLVNMIVTPFFIQGWRLYLLEISLYANFVGHWSGWSAERPTEIEQED